MDLAEDTAVAPRDGRAHGTVLVRFGRLVRLGILPLHGLALANPPSYIQLLIRLLTGIVVEPRIADALALITLTVAILLSVMLRMRDRLPPSP